MGGAAFAFFAMAAWTYWARPSDTIPDWQADARSGTLLVAWIVLDEAYRWLGAHIEIGWTW